jgi:hypothetical protein
MYYRSDAKITIFLSPLSTFRFNIRLSSFNYKRKKMQVGKIQFCVEGLPQWTFRLEGKHHVLQKELIFSRIEDLKFFFTKIWFKSRFYWIRKRIHYGYLTKCRFEFTTLTSSNIRKILKNCSKIVLKLYYGNFCGTYFS